MRSAQAAPPSIQGVRAVAPPHLAACCPLVVPSSWAVHLSDIPRDTALIGPTSHEPAGGGSRARRWRSSRSAELTYRSGASGGTVWRAWAKRCLRPVGAKSGRRCRHGSRQLDRRRVGLAALRRELSV